MTRMSQRFFDAEHLTYPSELWPHTVEEAVDLLLAGLRDKDKETISQVADYFSLIGLCHHGLGTYIRNQFGLWNGNKELLEACGFQGIHPDDASAHILCALWKKLRP